MRQTLGPVCTSGMYGTRPHEKGCDRKIRAKSLRSGGGVACRCGARWFCW